MTRSDRILKRTFFLKSYVMQDWLWDFLQLSVLIFGNQQIQEAFFNKRMIFRKLKAKSSMLIFKSLPPTWNPSVAEIVTTNQIVALTHIFWLKPWLRQIRQLLPRAVTCISIVVQTSWTFVGTMPNFLEPTPSTTTPTPTAPSRLQLDSLEHQ